MLDSSLTEKPFGTRVGLRLSLVRIFIKGQARKKYEEVRPSTLIVVVGSITDMPSFYIIEFNKIASLIDKKIEKILIITLSGLALSTFVSKTGVGIFGL